MLVSALLAPKDLWKAWSFEPWIVIPLGLALVIYVTGLRRLAGTRVIGRGRNACFLSGWVILAISLLSPLHELGETLFSAHMAQHELMMLVAAPLLVLGRPLPALIWGLPRRWRPVVGRAAKWPPWRRLWQWGTEPFSAWLLHGAALWIWHAPPLYDAAVAHQGVHALQHVCFLGSALLFWWALFVPRAQGGMSRGAGVIYTFTTALHSSVLGAMLTFSGTLWYPIYASRTAAWHWTPVQDQQLGGLIMWIPGGTILTLIGLALMALWLRESDLTARPVPARKARYEA